MKLNKNWLIATALLCIGYATFQLHARGGDAFAGALGGSLMGGVIGSAMTNNNRGGGGGSRGVDRLSDRVDDLRAQVSEIKHAIANDLRTLRKAQEQLEKQVKKLLTQRKQPADNATESEEEVEVV